MISEQTVVTAFLTKLGEYGISPSSPDDIRLDGAFHRLHVQGDRRGSKNLSYKIHFDDRPAGWFEYHKTGETGSFSVANGQDLDPAAREAQRAAWREREKARAAEQARQHAERAAWSQRTWEEAEPGAHPYLTAKGITNARSVRVAASIPREQAFPGAEPGFITGALLVPVCVDPGVISSLQLIEADGNKLFIAGGQMAGAYHAIAGTDRARILVCEGYATGAALREVTGYSVACAMSAGNLEAVARKMRDRMTDREVVICADNDHGTAARTGRNPGLAAAEQAASSLGLRFVAPEFAADATGTDWDDWLRAGGDADVLRRLVNGEVLPAALPEPAPLAVATIEPETLPRRFRVDMDAPLGADEFVPLPYGESAIAGMFAGTIDHNLRYVDEWGRWLVWDGLRWEQDRLRHALELSKQYCIGVADTAIKDGRNLTTEPQKRAVASRYMEKRTIMNIAELAKSDPRIAASASQWDADPWAINTPGGVVDLTTGKLRTGRREDHMTKLTRVAPGGTCPTWLRFLHIATGGDQALIDFLQRMCGYTLTGSTRDHALFFVYGTGGNGKGTFLNTLQWIIGDYARVAGMDVFTERKHDAHTTELARLMGARLVTAQETEEGKRWAEARIKALTGGDPITARFMRMDDFEFLPQFKLVIAGNHKPGLRNVDEAIKRRLHLIPFTATIDPADRDVRLSEKLQAEASGILQWCIEGCLKWQQGGLQAPKSVVAATAEYLEQQDTIGLWMEECCITGPTLRCRRGTLYDSFKEWAEASGEYALPQKRWVAAIQVRGIESGLRDGVQWCKGVDVKNTVNHAGRGKWGNKNADD